MIKNLFVISTLVGLLTLYPSFEPVYGGPNDGPLETCEGCGAGGSGNGCATGGPGATSCAHTASVAGVSHSVSVSCQAGYYACCNAVTVTAECRWP